MPSYHWQSLVTLQFVPAWLERSPLSVWHSNTSDVIMSGLLCMHCFSEIELKFLWNGQVAPLDASMRPGLHGATACPDEGLNDVIDSWFPCRQASTVVSSTSTPLTLPLHPYVPRGHSTQRLPDKGQ